jgi:hypothetical protein
MTLGATLSNALTPEILTLFLVILVPFGGALFWLGVVHNKLNSLKDDVKDLQKDAKKSINV